MHIFDKGHTISYNIGNFTIKENLKVKGFDNNDIYYFEIKQDNFKINFQLIKNYNKDKKIIKKIKYIKTNKYKCILPIYKNNDINSDIMCLKGNTIIYANNLNDKEINNFKKSLKKFGYNSSKYKDKSKSKKISNLLSANYKNIQTNHYIAVENYKGITLIGKKIRNINIFENDIYKKQVSIFTDKYYVVADYNSEYTFKIFYVVNLINGNIKEIRSYNDISFDTVIEGVVNNEIYFFDKESYTQYKINIDNEIIKKIGTKDNLIKYQDKKWKKMSLTEALEGKTFDDYTSKNEKGYKKTQKIGTNYGYYYLYKKVNNKYKVYRKDIQNKDILTYLFTTTDINSVMFRKNNIYFVNENTLYNYKDNKISKIITSTEKTFNNDIDFGVSIK